MNKYNLNILFAVLGAFVVMIGTFLMNEYDLSYVLLIPLFVIILNQFDIMRMLNKINVR